MRVCNNCGNEVDDGYVCQYCGEASPSITSNSPNVSINAIQESARKSYISAVVYASILSVLSIFIFSIGQTSLIGLIAGIVFSVATGVAMAIGGFYLIIIPLPIIYLLKYGCVKTHLSLTKRIIFGILCFIFLILVFVGLFAIGSL